VRLLLAGGQRGDCPQTHALIEGLPYAQRHLIECCFSKLKQFRRVATRYEKTARNYLAVGTLAATILWLRSVSTKPSPRLLRRSRSFKCAI